MLFGLELMEVLYIGGGVGVLILAGCVFEVKSYRLRRRARENKARRDAKLKKQLELRKHHARLQLIARRLADDAQKYIKLMEDGERTAPSEPATLSRSPKGAAAAAAAARRGFDAFTGVIPGGVAGIEEFRPDPSTRSPRASVPGDDYAEVTAFGNGDGRGGDDGRLSSPGGDFREGTKTPARVAATRAAAAAHAAQAVALAAAKLAQLAEAQLREAEAENDSQDEDFIREIEEGMVEAAGIDPIFVDEEDDDFDTVTIGETGFQYKVRAGGLDGAPDLGDEELDRLYSESWRAAMQVELGGHHGGNNKRNALAGGGNLGGADGRAVAITLPSLPERAARQNRSSVAAASAMSSLGPTRPGSATIARDAGRILSMESFDGGEYEESPPGGVHGQPRVSFGGNDGRAGLDGGGDGGANAPRQTLVRRMDGTFDRAGAS